jgi:hypothetical protein
MTMPKVKKKHYLGKKGNDYLGPLLEKNTIREKIVL